MHSNSINLPNCYKSYKPIASHLIAQLLKIPIKEDVLVKG